MTLPILGFRRTTGRALHHPLVWMARELSLDAQSGQTGTLTRAATRAVTDSFSTSRTVNWGQPAWDGSNAKVSLSMGASENLKWSWGALPLAMSGMVTFYENGALAGGGGILSITSSGLGSPYLLISSSATQYRVVHNNAVSSVTATMTGTAPTAGQFVTLRWQLASTGTVQIWQSINGAAETTPGATGVLTLGAAWGSPTNVYLNSLGDSSYGVSKFVGCCITLGSNGQTALNQILA